MQTWTEITDDKRPALPDELARMPYVPFWSGAEEFRGQSEMTAPGKRQHLLLPRSLHPSQALRATSAARWCADCGDRLVRLETYPACHIVHRRCPVCYFDNNAILFHLSIHFCVIVRAPFLNYCPPDKKLLPNIRINPLLASVAQCVNER